MARSGMMCCSKAERRIVAPAAEDFVGSVGQPWQRRLVFGHRFSFNFVTEGKRTASTNGVKGVLRVSRHTPFQSMRVRLVDPLYVRPTRKPQQRLRKLQDSRCRQGTTAAAARSDTQSVKRWQPSRCGGCGDDGDYGSSNRDTLKETAL